MSTELKNELTIVRVLDAPREKVWRACREPEALQQWWGLPDGATMPVCNVDFRVGGALHFECEGHGTRIWFTCVYREIVEGEKLVLEQHKSDQSGRELDSADWPASIITLRFEDLNGKTKLTVTHTGMASALNAVDDFREGWSQSLNRLADSLTSG
jgi:uncharacterized protein YndB with AHSA1/START domain